MLIEYDLSVVMPSYKEADNLSILLPRLISSLNDLGIKYEIIVVDTVKPMDSTQLLCKLMSVTYLPRFPDNSFGSAVRTGIAHSSGKKILFMDSDGSHTPEFIPTMYERAETSDIVIASRYVKTGKTDNPWHLIVMSRLLNIVFSLILGLPCKDVSNSLKIYKASDVKNLVLRCNNFDIVEELLYKVYRGRSDLIISEIPFFFKKRVFGETKRNLLMFMLTYFFTIIKLRFFV
jgi:dolichol-phosphate mannosyltransferase